MGTSSASLGTETLEVKTLADNADQLKEKMKVGDKSDLAEIRDLLGNIVDNMKEKEKSASIEDEWKALALILDRIFFWITFIAAIVMIPTFLARTDTSTD